MYLFIYFLFVWLAVHWSLFIGLLPKPWTGVSVSSLFPVINRCCVQACRTHHSSHSLKSHPADLGDVMTAKIGYLNGRYDLHAHTQFHWQYVACFPFLSDIWAQMDHLFSGSLQRIVNGSIFLYSASLFTTVICINSQWSCMSMYCLASLSQHRCDWSQVCFSKGPSAARERHLRSPAL